MQARAPNVVDYKNKRTLELLARDLNRVVQTSQQKFIIAALIDENLMTMDWWLRAMRKIAGPRKWQEILTMLWDQSPGLLDGMWHEVIRHMTDGRDTQDSQSAGGHNYAEMVRFTDILDRAGYRPGNVLVMTALNEGFFQDSTVANAAQLKEDFHLV